MHIKEPVVEFKPNIFGTMLGVFLVLLTCTAEPAYSNSRFHLEKGSQGLIQPFKAISVPLPEFVREYSRITSTQFIVGGSWEQELKGAVTLFLRHPLKREDLTELLYRALADNGYAIVNGSAGNGLIIEKTRDARDDALPVYEASEVPNSSQLVTVYRNLKYANAENVSRMMRSFMPANARIIPTSRSQVFITDTASNIRKLNMVISRLDTQEAAKKQGEATPGPFGPPRVCGEHRIEKLVVEKLEIQGNDNSGVASPIKNVTGGRK